jgi:hypothetical protein
VDRRCRGSAAAVAATWIEGRRWSSRRRGSRVGGGRRGDVDRQLAATGGPAIRPRPRVG